MKEAGDMTSSDWDQTASEAEQGTKTAVQAGVYNCLLPFICFSYGFYSSVSVTCYAYRGNAVYRQEKNNGFKMRQVPIREFPTKFPDWDLSHSFKFGIFVGILLIIFSCDIILTRQSLGRPRAPPEPEPFKVHSRRWGVIPILIRDKSNVYVLRQSAELECNFVRS